MLAVVRPQPETGQLPRRGSKQGASAAATSPQEAATVGRCAVRWDRDGRTPLARAATTRLANLAVQPKAVKQSMQPGECLREEELPRAEVIACADHIALCELVACKSMQRGDGGWVSWTGAAQQPRSGRARTHAARAYTTPRPSLTVCRQWLVFVAPEERSGVSGVAHGTPNRASAPGQQHKDTS